LEFYLASYYAYLPRMGPIIRSPLFRCRASSPTARPFATSRPATRAHGVLDNKTGSPWLEGQSAVRIRSQLEAFASGERRKDIGEQMRNAARRMTPKEIEEAEQYPSPLPMCDRYRPDL
jgi:cytochrome c553